MWSTKDFSVYSCKDNHGYHLSNQDLNDMTTEPKVQKIAPAELLKMLASLNIEQTTELALFGPNVSFSGYVDYWPLRLFENQIVFQLTENLSELPNELFRLNRLQTLILWSLALHDESIAKIAKYLKQLNSLDLGFNRVGAYGARSIAQQLNRLTRLNLNGNNISDNGVHSIAKQLTKLCWLDLSHNQIGDDGAHTISQHLTRLTWLNLTHNKISNAGVRFIAQKLTKLNALGLSNNNINEVGVHFIAQKLIDLELLDLSDNQLNDESALIIAQKITGLKWLDLSHNQISDYGVLSIAQQLTKLNWLDLSNNKKITSVDSLVHFKYPIKLNLANTEITDLSSLKTLIIAGLQINWFHYINAGTGIYVEECPLIHPPEEIVKQGPWAVRNYFIELEAQGTDRLFEAKLLIVGEGGAGKTSLLRRMFQQEKKLPTEDETTRGIDIYRHEFPITGNRTFRLNAWDFGGQQIYHATHQFFLTRRSLYVLVDDTRSDNSSIHDEGLKFWLEVVETLSESSPLLIFQNEKGGRSKKIDEPGIRGRFINVKDFYRGNLEHPGSADSLRKAVEHFAPLLPHVGEDVPARWVDIRKELEELAETHPYISLDKYFAAYGHHLELNREKALRLSSYLHDLGVFLHFQSPPELRRTVFLQNRWVTEAVFRILDDEEVKANRGRFTVSDCDRLWADQDYANKDVELRALMERFELAYRLPDFHEETWLVPQHLSPSKPSELNEWEKTGDLVLTYRYEFLPRGLVSRLMVRMHRFVKQTDLCWSHGALFDQDKTQLLVETTKRGNEIALRSRGPEQKALLSVIASNLDALNESFRGLKNKVSKMVPCICKTCKGLIEPAMFEQKELMERRHRGKRTIECPKPPDYLDVSVIDLLEGISLPILPQWAYEPEANDVRFAIAVSFPSEHRAFVLDVVEHLSKEMERKSIFYDEWHEARLLGSGGDLKLQECYKQADLVIPFFSEHYTKQWCSLEWETIRGIFLDRRKDDAVIPVHLDNTEIPGWPVVSFGIRPKGRNAKQIAELILEAYRLRY